MTYIQQDKPTEGCVFCSAVHSTADEENLVVHRGQECFIILNRYPYTSGHIMIVPNQHCASLHALSPFARSEMMELSSRFLQALEAVYHPEGYNLGINMGEAAGAGIAEHIHLHIVPRWTGDTNFMSTLGQVRVLPESLEDTYARLLQAWKELS